MKRLKKFAALTIMAVLVLSASVAASEKRTVNITGSGTLKVEPNIAYINIGVRTSNREADVASKENMQKIAAVVEKIAESGVEKKDIRTQNYNIYPMYDSGGTKEELTVLSYEVSNSLTVTVRNIEDVGKIIDAAIAGGSNMMNGLSYGVEDSSIYYGSLYAKALEDAGAKAKAIGEALGIALTAPVTISEGSYIAPVAYRSLESGGGSIAAANMIAGTYTSPGEIELTTTLNVVYEY